MKEKTWVNYFLLGFMLCILVFLFTRCTTLSPLNKCLEVAQSSSWFKEEVKDTAYLTICERYHRAELVDKYATMMVPKKKIKNNKLVNDLDKDGKIQYILESVMTRKAILLYIGAGQIVD